MSRELIRLNLAPPGAGVKALGAPGSAVLAEILRALGLQEFHRAAHLLEPVHAVFDRDPPAIAHLGQDRKNGVVIVEPLARHAVQELIGVSGRALSGAGFPVGPAA